MSYTQDEIDQITREYAARKHKGRPRIPLSERKVATSVYLAPHVIEAMVALGDGNLSRGITKASALVATQQEASLAAIKAAAERRDQTKVGTDFD